MLGHLLRLETVFKPSHIALHGVQDLRSSYRVLLHDLVLSLFVSILDLSFCLLLIQDEDRLTELVRA